MSSRHNRVASAGVVGGMKPVLAVVALAGTVTLVTACSGGGASPAAVSAGSVSPVVSASPVNSGTIGVSPPVTVAEVRAAGGVYRLPLPFPSVTATPYGVYVSWDVTSHGRATSDVLARIDPPSGRITVSVLTDGFGQALAADGRAETELLRGARHRARPHVAAPRRHRQRHRAGDRQPVPVLPAQHRQPDPQPGADSGSLPGHGSHASSLRKTRAEPQAHSRQADGDQDPLQHDCVANEDI